MLTKTKCTHHDTPTLLSSSESPTRTALRPLDTEQRLVKIIRDDMADHRAKYRTEIQQVSRGFFSPSMQSCFPLLPVVCGQECLQQVINCLPSPSIMPLGLRAGSGWSRPSIIQPLLRLKHLAHYWNKDKSNRPTRSRPPHRP